MWQVGGQVSTASMIRSMNSLWILINKDKAVVSGSCQLYNIDNKVRNT